MKIPHSKQRLFAMAIMAFALALELAACGAGNPTTTGGSPGGGLTPFSGPGGGGGVAGGFTIGGSVSAVSGTVAAGLTLQNASDVLTLTATVSAPVPFTFPTAYPTGTAYNVSIVSQPSGGQTCTISANSGVVGTANVTNVAVQC